MHTLLDVVVGSGLLLELRVVSLVHAEVHLVSLRAAQSAVKDGEGAFFTMQMAHVVLSMMRIELDFEV